MNGRIEIDLFLPQSICDLTSGRSRRSNAVLPTVLATVPSVGGQLLRRQGNRLPIDGPYRDALQEQVSCDRATPNHSFKRTCLRHAA